MLIAVDSNIVFSCLIKGVYSKNLGRILMLEEDFTFIIPEEGLAELHEHAEELRDKANSFNDALIILFTRIHVIPKEFYEDKIKDAFEIAKEFDEEDTPFIALALKLNVPIWTNDKQIIIYGLKSGKYLALDTQAIEDLIKGKSLEDVKEELKRRYDV